MQVPPDELTEDFGAAAYTEPPLEAKLQKITIPALSLALLSAIGAFAIFAAARPDSTDPVQRLALASILCAVPSAALTIFWPAFPRVFGLLVSSCFSVFLLVAFFSFLINGSIVWWPLMDAAIVITAALCGAHLGVFVRQHHTRRSRRHAGPGS